MEEKLNISKTIFPEENFETMEQWQDAVGIRSEYRADGSYIGRDVRLDEWIFINRLIRGIPVFNQETWNKFVSHKFSN